jgi:hypothetical protein
VVRKAQIRLHHWLDRYAAARPAPPAGESSDDATAVLLAIRTIGRWDELEQTAQDEVVTTLRRFIIDKRIGRRSLIPKNPPRK